MASYDFTPFIRYDTEPKYMNPLSHWGQWDSNPRPPAPRANTSKNKFKSAELVSCQARRWPPTNLDKWRPF